MQPALPALLLLLLLLPLVTQAWVPFSTSSSTKACTPLPFQAAPAPTAAAKPSLLVLAAGRRWGGPRKKIEEDGDGGKGKKTPPRTKASSEEEEEDEEDPLAISDAQIDDAMGRARGEKPTYADAVQDTGSAKVAAAAAAAAKQAGGEPSRWSMEWLETLSEDEMLNLDKKRLMDFLLRDIESDKEWASVPEEAVFAPEEELDPKLDFYDEKLTEEIFGKMPRAALLANDDDEEDEDEEDEPLDLDDILGALDEDDEAEDDEDLVRFLSQSAEGRKLAADLLNDDDMRDDEEDEDMFDLGAHLRPEEMSPAEVQEGLKHLLAGLKRHPQEEGERGADDKLATADPAALLAAIKTSVEQGELHAASELLQRMEELGMEVGDLEEHAEVLESYRRPLTNKREVLQQTAAVPLSGGRLSEEEVAAMKQVGACVGIDLGTTNSAVSVIKEGRAVILPSRSTGDNVLPSVVRFGAAGAPIVGKAARDTALEDSDNTFTSVKRLIGRTLDELVKEKEILGTLNMVRHSDREETEEEENGDGASVAMYCPALRREVTPEEVSAEILKTLLGDASAYLGQTVNRAVITVPAYFTPEQCAATERAGQLAGLQRIKLLREPEAAALAYGLDKEMDDDELIMVFDLGGGTFDVSVLEVGDGVVEVLATFGDNHMGGNDFDKRVADWLAAEYKKQHGGQGPPSDRFTMRRLLEAAEHAKVRLSQIDKVDIALPGLGGPGKDLAPVKLSRQQMETLCSDLYDRLLQPMRQAALMAGATLGGEVAPDALGGQLIDSMGAGGKDAVLAAMLAEADETEMVSDKKKLAELMRDRALKGRQVSKARSQYNKNLNAVRKRNPGVKIREFPQGRLIQEVVMVGGATRMPSIQRLVEAVTGIKPRTTVNPDEAVALGAGIHAGVLDGTIEDMDMMTPMQAAIMRGLMDFEAREGKAGPRSQKQKKGF